MPDTINRASIPLTAPIDAPGMGQHLPGQARMAIDNVLEYDVDHVLQGLEHPDPTPCCWAICRPPVGIKPQRVKPNWRVPDDGCAAAPRVHTAAHTCRKTYRQAARKSWAGHPYVRKRTDETQVSQ